MGIYICSFCFAFYESLRMSLRHKKKRVTVTDIAKEAGVSLKTASRALNNSPHVRKEKREAVLRAAKKFNFRPNISARQLASNRSYVITHFYDNLNTDYLSKIYTGMQQACHKHGYYAVAEATDYSRKNFIAQTLDYASSFNIDGLILSPPLCDDAKLIEALKKQDIKLVLISPQEASNDDYYVFVDEERSAFEITEHLITLGHENIAFLGGLKSHKAASDRQKGFISAMKHHGLNASNKNIKSGDFTMQSGHDAYVDIMKKLPEATAIFAANDEMAMGVIMAALNDGKKIPDEIAIAGYDNIRFSGLFWPSLTTVSPPVIEMANYATNLLIRLISGETIKNKRHEFVSEIIIRKSTNKRKSS